jgi:hypothetical protein
MFLDWSIGITSVACRSDRKLRTPSDGLQRIAYNLTLQETNVSVLLLPMDCFVSFWSVVRRYLMQQPAVVRTEWNNFHLLLVPAQRGHQAHSDRCQLSSIDTKVDQ